MNSLFCRNFLEFGNLQEHLEKILAEHSNESKPSMRFYYYAVNNTNNYNVIRIAIYRYCQGISIPIYLKDM